MIGVSPSGDIDERTARDLKPHLEVGRDEILLAPHPTFCVYGHGSWFAGTGDPADIDVLVVTDLPLDRSAAAGRVAPILNALGAPHTLPLDVSVAQPHELSLIERAIVHHSTHLAGDDIAAGLAPIRPYEWAWAMANLTAQQAASAPAAAALDAVRAVWAGTGRVVVPKSAVVAAAAGGPWESLTAAAWAHRHADHFDHPDLTAATAAAAWAAAGEAATTAYETKGWSSKDNRAAILTVYRQVLTADEIRRIAATPATRRQTGGWAKSRIDDDPLVDCFASLTNIANIYWWHHTLAGFEPLHVHRHRPNDVFPAHVDRLPIFPTRAFNVVAMIQPAATGGRLYLDLGGHPIEPDLDPGDVVIFDSSVLHGVTSVEAGERITLVSLVHAHRDVGGWGPKVNGAPSEDRRVARREPAENRAKNHQGGAHGQTRA